MAPVSRLHGYCVYYDHVSAQDLNSGNQVTAMIDGILTLISFPAAAFCVAAGVFFFLDTAPKIKCNPEHYWINNPDLKIDILYLIINTLLKKYLMLGVAVLIWMILLPISDIKSITSYVKESRGPLGALPFYYQVCIYLILSDFCMYWLHRAFHHHRLWKYHAAHHSEKQVDWTTAYRFHPMNIAFSPVLTDLTMLHLGISPEVMFFLRPFDAAYSFFVHANLNCTLGVLRYVVATPVFHRWHHASKIEARSKNFAPTFAIWDVVFGSFYMPKGAYPTEYGIDDPDYPNGLIQQLIYPFRKQNRSIIS